MVLLFLIDWTTKFPRYDKTNRLGHITLSAVEVAVYGGHKVLMEDDDNSLLIVGDTRGILGQQLRPHPIPVIDYCNYINYVFIYSIICCLFAQWPVL